MGWDAGLYSACVGRRRGKVGPNVCCLRSGDEHGACVGHGVCVERGYESSVRTNAASGRPDASRRVPTLLIADGRPLRGQKDGGLGSRLER